RPLSAGANHREPRHIQRPPETPAEKRGGERVLKESSGGGARGFRGPPEGDHGGGSAHGLRHPVVPSSTSPRPWSGTVPCQVTRLVRRFTPAALLSWCNNAGCQARLEA